MTPAPRNPSGDPPWPSTFAQREAAAAAAAAAGTNASRFVEGSMNDRASAVPPPSFLGSDEERIAAYQRQFFGLGGRGTRTSWQSGAPSESSTSASARRGFWDGVRERFHLGAAKGKNGGGADDGRPAFAGIPRTARGNAAAAAAERPTRDEMMANYHELMKAGFFSAHAIQSTRHAPPGTAASTGAPYSEEAPSPARGPPPAPTWAPPPPPPSAHGQAPPPIPPMQIVSVAYEPARSSISSTPSPSLDYPRPMTDGHASYRGTKRPLPPDPDADDTTSARKLVKKLRASASRVGADLTLLRPSPTNADITAASGGASRPATSASASAPRAGFLGAPIVFATRSVSSAFSAPPPASLPPASPRAPRRVRMQPRSPGRAPPGSQGGRKLCKAPAAERRSAASRSRSRSRRSRSPSTSAAPSPRKSPRRRLSKASLPGSPMKIDSAPGVPVLPPAAPTRSLALGSHPPFGFGGDGPPVSSPSAALPLPLFGSTAATGRAAAPNTDAPAPSFHFPSRTRPPLSIVPDPNRGIPDVPALPAGLFALPNKHISEHQHRPPPTQGRKASSGSFRFGGSRDGDGADGGSARSGGWRGIRFR